MKQLQILTLSFIAIMGVSTWPTLSVAQDYGRDQFYGDRPVRNPVRDAYEQGMREGRWAAQRGRRPNPTPQGWDSERLSRAYQIGYDRGYDQAMSERGGWTDRDIYQKGLSAGDWDAHHNRSFNPRPEQFVRDEQGRRAFIAGYNRGFHDVQAFSIGGLEIFLGGLGGSGRRQQEDRDRHSEGLYNPQYDRSEGGNNNRGGNYQQNDQRGNYQPAQASVTIQGNNVTWQSRMPNSRVFVMEDNKPERLFASSPNGSGTQAAPWISRGHFYIFILRDQNGNELSRSQVDMR